MKEEKTIFYRKLDLEEKAKLNQACSLAIDFLHQKLKLKKWECYFVVKTLYEEFPLEELAKVKG